MTIEIHEVDITDGLNKMLFDKLKVENEKLRKQVTIALKGLKKAKFYFEECDSDPLSGLHTVYAGYMHEVYKTFNRTLKELEK